MGQLAESPLLIEGKTKKVFLPAPKLVDVFSKDVMTAGNGKRHAIIPGKGKWSTKVTCNVFEAFQACGLPVAFSAWLDDTTFRAPRADIQPFEVVVRRVARGSVLKTHPSVKDGKRFEKLVVQFFLKTSGKRVGDMVLPEDDMLVSRIRTDGLELSRPDLPLGDGNPPIFVPFSVIGLKPGKVYPFTGMQRRARQGFLILESLWADQGLFLNDCKFEFGFDSKGNLLLADVVDPDSWRLRDAEGRSHDKDPFRKAATTEEGIEAIRNIYPDLAARSERFSGPTSIARALDHMRFHMRQEYKLPDEIETATNMT